MRFVKIDSLSKEEREEAFRQQEERRKRIQQQNIERQKQAKEEFENLSNKETNNTKNIGQTLWDSVKYQASKAGLGVAQGFTGIAQAGITDSANEAQKGSKKSTVELLSEGTLANSLNVLSLGNSPLALPLTLTLGMINSSKEAIPIAQEKLVEGLKNGNGVGKSIINTTGKTLPVMVHEFINAVPQKAVSNNTIRNLGKMDPNLSEKYLEGNKKISEPIKELSAKVEENRDNQGKVTNFLGDAWQSVGNMAPSILASAAGTPAAGLITMGLSAKGQSTQEALDKGADLNEAVSIGDSKAMIELGTEMLTGGINIFGKGALDDIISKGIDKKVKNEVLNFLAKKGADFVGEIGEETISDILGTLIDRGTVNPNATYSIEDWKDTALTTVLSTAILNTLTGGYGKKARLNNAQEMQENNKLPQNENLNQITNTQEMQNENQNAQNNLEENKNEEVVKSTEGNNKLPQNATSGQMMTNYKNEVAQKQILPIQQNQIEITNEDTLETSAKKYNLKYQDISIQQVQEMLDKRGIKSRFDANAFNDSKTGAKYSYTQNQDGTYNREIIFNPNANKKTIVQEMAIHELTHDIMASNTDVSQKLSKDVLDWVRKDSEYETQRQSVIDAYSNDNVDVKSKQFQDMIDEEVLAKTLQTKFGTQEQVTRLVQENRNIAQRFYDWVLDKIDTFKNRNNEEYLFWKDIQKKFEKAYQNTKFNPKEESSTRFYVTNIDDFTDIQYNNTVGKTVSKKQYASLSTILGDEEYSRGIKEFEAYDYDKERYALFTVLYKNQNEWKIVDIEPTNSNEGNGINATINDGSEEGTRISRSKYEVGRNGVKENENTSNMRGNDEISSTKQKYRNDNIRYSTESNRIERNNVENSNKSSFSMDNKGRTLSKGQQEYFKDSVIRVKERDGWKNTIDKNGNLFEVYHGTNNDKFNIFNPDYIGSSNDTGWYGKGFYFAFTKGEAETYGNNVLSAYLNIKNPFNFSKEMGSYDGQTRGDINYDLGAFLINLNEKFPNLSKNIEMKYTGEYDSEYDGFNVEKVNANEVASKIKEVYDSPNLKIVEIDDMGRIKYAHSYADNINEYNIDESLKQKMLDNWILNQDDVRFAKGDLKYYPNLTIEDLNKMEEFFNIHNVNFKPNVFGYQANSRTEAENMRLSEATHYVTTEFYRNLERHTPETYMQDISEEFTEELKKMGYDGIIQSDTGDEIVAFYPEQIKRTDNLNPTSNQDIRYSNNSNFDEYISNRVGKEGTRTSLEELKLPTKKNTENHITDKDLEVLNKIYEKEGRTEVLPTKKTSNDDNKTGTKILEKMKRDKMTLKDSLDYLAQKTINKGHYIDQLAKKTNNKELTFAYDRALNSQAEGQYVVGVAQTDNKGNKIGKSINDIWKPVEDSKLVKEFSEYLLHKHNIDRSERHKYVFGKEITATDSSAIARELLEKHPEFKKWEKEIKQFNDNNLNNLKEAGLLSQDTIDYIKALYPNYVSIARAIEGNLYGKTDKTGVGAPLKKAVGGSADIQPLKDAMAEQVIRTKRLINENQVGIELAKSMRNSIVDEDIDIEYTPDLLLGVDTLIDEDKKTGDKFYMYFKDGKQRKIKINDNLYESLKRSEQYKIERTAPLRGVQKITNIHKSLLTSDNPVFVITNFFKDFQDGMFNSKYSSKFVKNYGKALGEIFSKGKYYESYMANGGMTNTYFDYNEGVQKKGNKFVEKIRNINEIVEQTPRLAEFISTLEAGKSLNEALYNSAEITTNFKRGGDIAKALNRNGAEFLNASIQGFDKQFRNLTGQNGAKGYINLLAKATVLGVLPSVLNHMLLDDDEDYKDLPESTKDLYYLFKSGDGKFIRIPKGRALSIFGATARRIMEASQGQDDSFKGLVETFVNQIAPNNPLEDNILAPVSAVLANKTWYGSDLVSSRLQKELPKNQYDETTDEVSKLLGDKLNISPKKINYLLDQYSGGVGDILLPMMTPQAKENVFVDKFSVDSVLKNKNVSKFFETIEKQTQISNDSFATDEDKLQLKYLNSKLSEVNDLHKEKREVQMSKISQDEKKVKVREIQAKINETVENALDNYKKKKVDNNSATVGESKYYKDSKGNWKEVSEETEEKIKDISLETYSDFNQKTSKMKAEKVKNGEMTEKQQLKNKDKIQILLDSKYSNKEIGSIYENYIKSEKDTEYDIIKKAGIDVKEYLKYKQQDFESDKKDDGTLKGKTVSKSKQKKVLQYLNSMKISGDQRLLLYAMQGYTTTASQKKQLANYVYGLTMNKDDKLELYNKFSGFKVYKDGRVTW